MIYMKKTVGIFVTLSVLAGCAGTPQVVVDPKSIVDGAKYQQDLDECTKVASSYNLSESAGKNAAVGAAAGGVAVAGIATAIAGAVFLPAIPFIIAGTAAGATIGGGTTKVSEKNAREKILAECLTERGYKTYKPE